MELRIKELCKAKGLTIADIADRIGMDASNLHSSLKGNPSLKRLQQVAEALNVGVGDLFAEREPDIYSGTLTIDGQTYKVARATSDTLQLPHYTNYADFREMVCYFVEKSIEEGNLVSCMGVLDSTRAFSVAYCPNEKIFVLSLCVGAEISTRIYDTLEYSNRDEIAVEELAQEIINDIESPITKG